MNDFTSTIVLFEEHEEPLTFPIPDSKPDEGTSLPDTNNSCYSPESSYPEIHESEIDKLENPNVN